MAEKQSKAQNKSPAQSTMYELSGVDLHFLCREFQVLENSKVDKVTQLDKNLFVLRFFKDKNKLSLRLVIPDIVNLTEKKYDSPLQPLGFCTFLRKYLQNTRLNKIYQYGFERILVLEFQTLKYGELHLIIELFKPGNMVLCKKEEDSLLILNALERQAFKTRKIQARENYIFPPTRINPLKLNEEEIKKQLLESGKTLGKALATDFGLGGVYAEEIISRSGLDRDAKTLSVKEVEKLSETLKKLFAEEVNCFETKGKIYPIKMKSVPEEKNFKSFNEGLDTIVIESKIATSDVKESLQKKSKTEKLLQTQIERTKDLELEAEESQKTGEFIYEHYQEFQKLLDAVKKMRAEGKSFDEIEQALKKNKHFKSMNKAKKEANLDF